MRMRAGLLDEQKKREGLLDEQKKMERRIREDRILLRLLGVAFVLVGLGLSLSGDLLAL